MMNMNHTADISLSLTAASSSMEALNSFANSVAFESKEANTMDYLETANTARLGNYTATDGNRTYQLDPVLIERFTQNRSIDGSWYTVLFLSYLIIIGVGTFGSILVVIAVVRKPLMRTARNLFILNLAFSDLLLCLVTMPLTMMEILAKYWPFGTCSFLCKMIAMMQAVSIFVSTMSITAIAFDRYQVIVNPTRESLTFKGVIYTLLSIWLLAFAFASPLFIYKRLIYAEIPPMLEALGIHGVAFCIEDWPMAHGRFYYSAFSLCIQYLVPILLVSGSYFGIYNKLKNRITVVTVQTSNRKAERGRRMKRTNCLLISIAVIFGISWLPLNFINLYADIKRSEVTESLRVWYAICHMFAMTSACTNPFLYGWLNDNFRKEFYEIFFCCCSKETTNVALNGHTTGSGQTRRRRKHADIAKGDLKLLGSGSGCGGGCNGGDDGDDCGADDYAGTNGLRSVVTESYALTENPMSTTEVMTLMPR